MVEDEFPTCLDALTQRLGRVEANLREQKKAYGDIVNRVINSNGGSGTKRSGNSEREAIPRKQQKTAKEANGSKTGSLYKKSGVASTEGHKKKHCDLCAKFSPWSSGTHNTIQCFKWNVDGTEKACRTDSGRGNIREKAKRYSNAIKKAEKLKKKMKKMKRKQKRSKKRRSSGYDSSSSSSSSSSDSE